MRALLTMVFIHLGDSISLTARALHAYEIGEHQ